MIIVPVILSGGSGTRLWPLSRELHPKQLLPLVNEDTMLQGTLRRLENIDDLSAPMIICNDSHRFMVGEQLRAMNVEPAAILLEPVGRNTAPAVAIAAIQAISGGEDPVLLILPSDHVIENREAFQRAVNLAATYAETGKLITFGIVPTCPETGYGYIRKGEALADGIYQVERFVEKPDLATAENYLQTGEYVWNSGMFMFRASHYLEELDKFAPGMKEACQKAHSSVIKDLDFIRLDKDIFAGCPGDSIDYAVMEKTSDAVVIPLDAGWSDVGTWSALWEISEQDDKGNVVTGDVIMHEGHNNYVHASDRMVAIVGVKDHVIVETSDAVLVAHKDAVQDVKAIVEKLTEEEREERVVHRKVYRPWGSYESVDGEDYFQVKRIIVNPGSSISLQLHNHRAEHWIVVKGSACVTRGEDVFELNENESTFIPLGVKHRLENITDVPLEIVEVQSGDYLGEDDIVRFEDKYGRS